MSRVTGGIYSKPSGKTAGIVWGAARTRTGKVSTARQLVIPANPRTTLQVEQRTKFQEALFIVRALGSSIYADAWNRSIGQLPGFQSQLSIFLKSITALFDLNPIPSINLGTLHLPNSIGADINVAGNLTVNWSTELSGVSTTADLAQILLIPTSPIKRRTINSIISSTNILRNVGVANIAIPPDINTYIVITYFKGAGTAAGHFSITKSEAVIL
jgi:hypothetical protein